LLKEELRHGTQISKEQATYRLNFKFQEAVIFHSIASLILPAVIVNLVSAITFRITKSRAASIVFAFGSIPLLPILLDHPIERFAEETVVKIHKALQDPDEEHIEPDSI